MVKASWASFCMGQSSTATEPFNWFKSEPLETIIAPLAWQWQALIQNPPRLNGWTTKKSGGRKLMPFFQNLWQQCWGWGKPVLHQFCIGCGRWCVGIGGDRLCLRMPWAPRAYPQRHSDDHLMTCRWPQSKASAMTIQGLWNQAHSTASVIFLFWKRCCSTVVNAAIPSH